MNIALIADTHMPKGARRLPAACVERLKAVELIVHAGDFTALEILDGLGTYAPVVGVRGNVDEAAIRAVLPDTVEVDVSGRRIAVIHDAGRASGRLARLRRRFPTADAVVFGHSHLPLHERAQDGFQIFNPGSPTERRRAPWPTMGAAFLRNGELTFELVRLG
jgi:putative phosphoesterase